MRAIYIDTRHARVRTPCTPPRAYAVSVTLAERGIVLRYAAELPRIPDRSDIFVVDRTGYRRNSGAYCAVIGGESIDEVVGELTLTRSLRPVAPRKVAIFTSARFEEVRTHRNSNPDTASAAFETLAELYRDCSEAALIAWGQRDVTRAAVVSGSSCDMSLLGAPEEHRLDIITPLAVDAARVMDNFYRGYIAMDPTPDFAKHDMLRVKALAYLLGCATDWGMDQDSMTTDIAREIVRRLGKKGTGDLAGIRLFARGEDPAALEARAKECLDSICDRVLYKREEVGEAGA